MVWYPDAKALKSSNAREKRLYLRMTEAAGRPEPTGLKTLFNRLITDKTLNVESAPSCYVELTRVLLSHELNFVLPVGSRFGLMEHLFKIRVRYKDRRSSIVK